MDIGFQLLIPIFSNVGKADIEWNNSCHRHETSKFLQQEPGEVPAGWWRELTLILERIRQGTACMDNPYSWCFAEGSCTQFEGYSKPEEIVYSSFSYNGCCSCCILTIKMASSKQQCFILDSHDKELWPGQTPPCEVKIHGGKHVAVLKSYGSLLNQAKYQTPGSHSTHCICTVLLLLSPEDSRSFCAFQ